jgi:hypothetical protein
MMYTARHWRWWCGRLDAAIMDDFGFEFIPSTRQTSHCLFSRAKSLASAEGRVLGMLMLARLETGGWQGRLHVRM